MKTVSLALLLLVIMIMLTQANPNSSRDGDDLTRTISARSQQMWQAYLENDAAAHNAMLTGDYVAVHPDGTLHGLPSPQMIAAARLAGFAFSERKVWRLAGDVALSTYIADVEAPPGAQPPRVRYAASEIWVKRQGEWKCRFYQGTVATK